MLILIIVLWIALGLYGGYLILRDNKKVAEIQNDEQLTYLQFMFKYASFISVVFSVFFSLLLGPIILGFAKYIIKTREKDGMF